MNKGYWDEVIEYNHENTLDKNWSEYYDGALSPVSVLKENDAYVNRSEAFFALPAMPDDINAIRTSVGDKYVTMSWKIIYAKDEAEFEELWKQMVDECYALGAQQVIDWATENVEANVELLEKYTQEFK